MEKTFLNYSQSIQELRPTDKWDIPTLETFCGAKEPMSHITSTRNQGKYAKLVKSGSWERGCNHFSRKVQVLNVLIVFLLIPTGSHQPLSRKKHFSIGEDN